MIRFCLVVIVTFTLANPVLPYDVPEVHGTCVEGCGSGSSSSSRSSGGSSSRSGESERSKTFEEEYPHCHRGFLGAITPDEGYVFANREVGDFSVKFAPNGTPSKKHRHCVWDGNGHVHPAPGYRWCIRKSKDRYCVERIPSEGTPSEFYANVVYAHDGRLKPAPGYVWRNEESDEFEVKLAPDGTYDQGHPHVVYDGTGHRRPVEGYDWVSKEPNDFRVRPLPLGAPIPNRSDLVAAGGRGGALPAVGFEWVDHRDDSFHVLLNPDLGRDQDGSIQLSRGFRWPNRERSATGLTTAANALGSVAFASADQHVIELRQKAATELAALSFANWKLMMEGLCTVLCYSPDRSGDTASAEGNMREAKEHLRKFLEYKDDIDFFTGEKTKRDAEIERLSRHIYVQPNSESTFAVQVANTTARGQTDFSDKTFEESNGTRVMVYYELERVREPPRRDQKGAIRMHWDIVVKSRPIPENSPFP